MSKKPCASPWQHLLSQPYVLRNSLDKSVIGCFQNGRYLCLPCYKVLPSPGEKAISRRYFHYRIEKVFSRPLLNQNCAGLGESLEVSGSNEKSIPFTNVPSGNTVIRRIPVSVNFNCLICSGEILRI